MKMSGLQWDGVYTLLPEKAFLRCPQCFSCSLDRLLQCFEGKFVIEVFHVCLRHSKRLFALAIFCSYPSNHFANPVLFLLFFITLSVGALAVVCVQFSCCQNPALMLKIRTWCLCNNLSLVMPVHTYIRGLSVDVRFQGAGCIVWRFC